ncbi:hypothetical protein LB506_005969, partial [Fusarium annulatum]
QVSSLINLLTGNAMTLPVALAIDLVTITNLPSRLTFWRKPPAGATSVPRSLHDVRNRTNVPPYLFYGCSLHTDLTSPSNTEVGEELFSLVWASGSVPVVAPPTFSSTPSPHHLRRETQVAFCHQQTSLPPIPDPKIKPESPLFETSKTYIYLRSALHSEQKH